MLSGSCQGRVVFDDTCRVFGSVRVEAYGVVDLDAEGEQVVIQRLCRLRVVPVDDVEHDRDHHLLAGLNRGKIRLGSDVRLLADARRRK